MKQADRFNLEIAEFLAPIASQYPNRSEVSFVCIGTDRSTGDCFGPLVGTLLREQGWEHVIGTMEQPCDAYAVEQAVLMAENRAVVIAIDACLGKPQSVGTFWRCRVRSSREQQRAEDCLLLDITALQAL